MGTARIVEDFWTCRKRWDLEGYIYDHGHRFPRRPCGLPMSAAEHVALLLDWLDERSSPTGELDDVTPDVIERSARWSGKHGLFFEALVATHWIDVGPGGKKSWHDYSCLNGETIKERIKKRRARSELSPSSVPPVCPPPLSPPSVPPRKGDNMGGQDPPALGSGPPAIGTAAAAEAAAAIGPADPLAIALAARLHWHRVATVAEMLSELRKDPIPYDWLSTRVSETPDSWGRPWDWALAARKAFATVRSPVSEAGKAAAKRSVEGWAERAREAARFGRVEVARGNWAQAMSFLADAGMRPEDIGEPPPFESAAASIASCSTKRASKVATRRKPRAPVLGKSDLFGDGDGNSFRRN